MSNFESLLHQLQLSSHITKSSLSETSRQQGAYILWLDDNPPMCLKVGIAGPRRGTGLWERLKYHFSSHPGNSVLARHLAADAISYWTQGYDIRDREQRKRFLAEECYFQAISLPTLSRSELRQFEVFIERELRPKYRGRVGKTQKGKPLT